MDIHSFEQILSENLSWNRARIKFLARFLVALFQVQTVNLVKIASVFTGNAKMESQYKKIQRFLHFFLIDQTEIAGLVLRILKLAPPYTIAIDRTEWNLGRHRVNVLMLSISYKAVAIPLFWEIWDERGCSSIDQRKVVIEKFVKRFGVEGIRFVTADREFCSKDWLRYLIRQKLPFRLRIKGCYQITNSRGGKVRADQLCRTVSVGERRTLAGRRRLWGEEVFVGVTRQNNGDPVVVISSDPSEQILAEYGERWQIETLFSVLKTRGFNIADTHLTKPNRIGKLLSLLTLAVSWAVLTGELENKKKPIKIKKHGRLAKSLFRLGFDTLRNCFCQITVNLRQKQRFKQLTLLLSCT